MIDRVYLSFVVSGYSRNMRNCYSTTLSTKTNVTKATFHPLKHLILYHCIAISISEHNFLFKVE